MCRRTSHDGLNEKVGVEMNHAGSSSRQRLASRTEVIHSAALAASRRRCFCSDSRACNGEIAARLTASGKMVSRPEAFRAGFPRLWPERVRGQFRLQRSDSSWLEIAPLHGCPQAVICSWVCQAEMVAPRRPAFFFTRRRKLLFGAGFSADFQNLPLFSPSFSRPPASEAMAAHGAARPCRCFSRPAPRRAEFRPERPGHSRAFQNRLPPRRLFGGGRGCFVTAGR